MQLFRERKNILLSICGELFLTKFIASKELCTFCLRLVQEETTCKRKAQNLGETNLKNTKW